MNKYQDSKSEKINKSQIYELQMSKGLAISQINKIDSITDNSTLAQVQQNTSYKQTEAESKIIRKSQSPTQKLQQYMMMRDQAELRMTNKQMKQLNNNLVSQNVKRKNKSEWILQQLSRFSPQQVLNLEDPVILEAIKNLDLRVDEQKNWIQVSDFYNIQESTKMQMRRYLTALNEWFYKIESIIQERDRIILQQKKQKNKASAQNKIDKFYQNFTHSKYYREFDIEKGVGSSRGRVKKIQQSDVNKSDFINSLVMNSEGSHFIEDMKLQSSHPQLDKSQNMDSSKKLKNSDPNLKNIKTPAQSYSPQKQIFNNEPNVTKQLKQQQEVNQTSRNSLFISNILSQSKDTYQINKDNGEITEKIVELDGSINEKSEMSQSNKEAIQPNQAKPLLNQTQKSRYNKDDFKIKIKKKLMVEERLTNLRIHEALQYEEEQSNLQVTLKKKKLLSNQRKQQDLQNKLQKIKERNNYIDEKKNLHQLQKEEDINCRFQIIQKIQQEDEHFLNIKQKKEEIKQLMSFERDKQAQLKLQVMREQSTINADEEMKQKLEDVERINESIEMKNQKRESMMQAIQEKNKIQNEQKAQKLLKQYEYQKQLQEQIAGEIASKYSKSAKFLKQLQKQRSQNINEINREFDKKQKEIEERMQNIEIQENLVKQEAKKLLQTRMSTSEAQRKKRLEELKQQISRTNLDKANKTMQSFYQIQKEKINKGDKYLQEEYNNRNNYQDHLIQKEQYLKKCAAIRINSSYERENIICSPKKISYIAQQIRSNQFKNVDHSF
ncbi:hypothetical protein ABPG72_010145 [Tetrahymena utriculariae]